MNTREEIRDWALQLGYTPIKNDGHFVWERDDGSYRDIYYKNGIYIDKLVVRKMEYCEETETYELVDGYTYDRVDIEKSLSNLSVNKIMTFEKPVTFEFFKSVLDYIES